MRRKISKYVMCLVASLFIISKAGFAQDLPTPPPPLPDEIGIKIDSALSNINMKALDLKTNKQLKIAMQRLNKDLKKSLKGLNKDLDLKNLDLNELKLSQDLIKNIDLSSLNKDLGNLSKDIAESLKDMDFNSSIEEDCSENVQQKTKNFFKIYSVDANDALSITNKYGKVIVNTWDKSEIKVDVQIKCGARSDEVAQKILDGISISDSKSGNTISFTTNFKKSSNDGSIWDMFSGRDGNRKIEVNYTIYMPSKNSLAINNRYGAIILPDFEGKLNIESSYGSFSGKNLNHTGNEIKVKYGSANIERLTSSNISIGYGNLDLGTVHKLNAEIHYGSAEINRVTGEATIDARYAGKVALAHLDNNFNNLTVNASYSNVTVGVSPTINANLDIVTHYGEFQHGEHTVTFTNSEKSSSYFTKTYKGYIGKSNSEKTITIRTNYGNIAFE